MADAEKTVHVTIRMSDGTKFEVDVDLSSTVGALKEKVVEKANCAKDLQRMIYKGRILKDDDVWATLGR